MVRDIRDIKAQSVGIRRAQISNKGDVQLGTALDLLSNIVTSCQPIKEYDELTDEFSLLSLIRNQFSAKIDGILKKLVVIESNSADRKIIPSLLDDISTLHPYCNEHTLYIFLEETLCYILEKNKGSISSKADLYQLVISDGQSGFSDFWSLLYEWVKTVDPAQSKTAATRINAFQKIFFQIYDLYENGFLSSSSLKKAAFVLDNIEMGLLLSAISVNIPSIRKGFPVSVEWIIHWISASCPKDILTDLWRIYYSPLCESSGYVTNCYLDYCLRDKLPVHQSEDLDYKGETDYSLLEELAVILNGTFMANSSQRIFTVYSLSDVFLLQFLALSFNHSHIKLCQNCGNIFLQSHGNSLYCDYPSSDTGIICSQTTAQQRFSEKTKSDPVLLKIQRCKKRLATKMANFDNWDRKDQDKHSHLLDQQQELSELRKAYKQGSISSDDINQKITSINSANNNTLKL